MKFLDINIASEYMVMAANLINIKSKMLLPSPQEVEQPEDDPREELVRRLLEYEKFKEAAQFLRDKERERVKYMTRPGQSESFSEAYVEVSIFDLISAFKTALKDVPKDMFLQVIKDEYTVEEKVHDLMHILLVKEKISLDELFGAARSKLEIVVTFLAILELIKLREIMALQERLFGPIIITRRDATIPAPAADQPQAKTEPQAQEGI
jgi:segregation and condensation protein A